MIHVKNLNVTLGDKPVLKDLTASWMPGTFHAICGANGSGKTTLLRVLAGLQTYHAGSVLFANDELKSMSLLKRSRLISWVPADQLMGFEYTGRDVIGWGQHSWVDPSAPSHNRNHKFKEAIDVMGVEPFLDRPMTSLSLGQQKRVQLTRAMASPTPILMLDEPTSVLDPAVSLDLMAWIKKAVKQDGRTVIASLHDLALAINHADSVILLKDGHLAAQDAAQVVLTSPLLSEVLGVQCRTLKTENGLATVFVRSPFGEN